MSVTRILSVLLLAATTGCAPGGGEDGNSVEAVLDGEDLRIDRPAEALLNENDRYAILSRDGKVRLGLTADQVYLRLSDELRARIDGEIGAELEKEPAVGRAIGTIVRHGVRRAAGLRATLDIDDVRDIHYSGGELIFDLEKNVGWRPGGVEIDDESVLRQFDRAEARRFIAEFRRVKAER